MGTTNSSISGTQMPLWNPATQNQSGQTSDKTAENDLCAPQFPTTPIESDKIYYVNKGISSTGNGSARLQETTLRAMAGRSLTSVEEIVKNKRKLVRYAPDDPRRKKSFESTHAHRAMLAKTPGALIFEEFVELLTRYDFKCLCCGDTEMIDADHIIPLGAEGSRNDISNIQPLCHDCNMIKLNESVDFRYDLHELTEFAKGLQIRAKEQKRMKKI